MFYIFKCTKCNNTACSEHYDSSVGISPVLTLSCPACNRTTTYNFLNNYMVTTPKQIAAFKASATYRNCVVKDLNVKKEVKNKK